VSEGGGEGLLRAVGVRKLVRGEGVSAQHISLKVAEDGGGWNGGGRRVGVEETKLERERPGEWDLVWVAVRKYKWRLVVCVGVPRV